MHCRITCLKGLLPHEFEPTTAVQELDCQHYKLENWKGEFTVYISLILQIRIAGAGRQILVLSLLGERREQKWSTLHLSSFKLKSIPRCSGRTLDSGESDVPGRTQHHLWCSRYHPGHTVPAQHQLRSVDSPQYHLWCSWYHPGHSVSAQYQLRSVDIRQSTTPPLVLRILSWTHSSSSASA